MALKHTQVELDLITDEAIYLTFENSIRGKISTIRNRYARSTIAWLKDSIFPNRPLSLLTSMLIIFMVPRRASLNPWVTFTFLPPRKFRNWTSRKFPKIRPRVTLSNAIWNIHSTCTRTPCYRTSHRFTGHAESLLAEYAVGDL